MTPKHSDGNSNHMAPTGSLYDVLSHKAPERAGVGETRTTKAVETVDEAPAEHQESTIAN